MSSLLFKLYLFLLGQLPFHVFLLLLFHIPSIGFLLLFLLLQSLLEFAKLAIHFLFFLLKHLVFQLLAVLCLLIIELLLLLLCYIDQALLVFEGFLDFLLLLHFAEQIVVDFSLVKDLVLHLIELCPFLKLDLLQLFLNLGLLLLLF